MPRRPVSGTKPTFFGAASSGGKARLGRISKMGDGYLRRPPVVGATALVRPGGNPTTTGAWIRALLNRKPTCLGRIAVANKTARIAWAILARGRDLSPSRVE